MLCVVCTHLQSLSLCCCCCSRIPFCGRSSSSWHWMVCIRSNGDEVKCKWDSSNILLSLSLSLFFLLFQSKRNITSMWKHFVRMFYIQMIFLTHEHDPCVHFITLIDLKLAVGSSIYLPIRTLSCRDCIDWVQSEMLLFLGWHLCGHRHTVSR